MRHSDRLRDARLLLGLTQEELASRAQVSQPIISMVERGDRSLTDEVAFAVSAALDLPVEFFSIPASTIPNSAIDFRKLKSSSAKDTHRARTLFKEAYRVANKLMVEEGYPFPVLPVIQDLEAPLPADRLEHVAALTRDHLSIDATTPIPNVMRVLERRGIGVAPLVFPNSDEDPIAQVQHFGASHWAGLGEHALIAYFVGASGDRDRFTLAHELAHVVLHTFRPHVAPDDRESEANGFASAFLFPLARARASIDADTKLKNLAEMKATWGVSMQAIIMRGKSTGLLSDVHASSLFKQISARGWRKAEPVHVAHESPALLRAIYERQYGWEPAKVAVAEKELALPIRLIRSLLPAPSRIEQRESPSNVVHVRFGA